MPTLKKNLLLVEDDVQLRTLLTAILTRSGYRVHVADDGFSALTQIHAGMPDVLISDLYMIGMSGFELLSVVRRRFPAIRVVAMSSAFSGGEVPAGVAADAFYQKATSVVSLLRLLDEAVAPGYLHLARRSISAPIWIVPDSICGGAQAVISCPDCLRTATYALTKSIAVLRTTECVHCRAIIHYAMLQTLDPRPTPTNPWQPSLRPESLHTAASFDD